jgi:sulfate permease, SulP family
VYAALRLIDVSEFRRFARFRRSELALALATTVAVLAVGVLYGVLVAVGLSILDLLRRVSRPHDGILGFVPGLAGMHDVDDYPAATTVPGLVVYRYDAPLCFANAENFRRRALAAVDTAHRRPDGCCSTWRPSWGSTSPPPTPSSSCATSSTVAMWSRYWPVSSRTFMPDLRHSGVSKRIGANRISPTLPTAVDGYKKEQRRPSPDMP